ncbi:MAG: alkaline phosphatase [Phycisphaerales bacterium]|nr:alkaline phosphatase [Phycisphaerales bacterium]
MARVLVCACVLWLVGCAGLDASAPGEPGLPQPRNIIVFVADGGGANAHRATEMWQGGPPAWQGRDWYRASVATFALRRGQRPPSGLDALAQDPAQVFDPVKAWDAAPVEGESGGYPYCFAGYKWLRATAPDSANTASAIYSGVPTYTGAINTDGALRPMRSASEAAEARGKAVGVVTSVPFSHATPAAGGGAHVPERDDYFGIAAEMLGAGVCDFIAGAGHPGFDNDGAPREPKFEWIAPWEFAALRAGTWRDQTGRRWTMIDQAEAIRSLVDTPRAGPLLVLAPVADTLQQERRSVGDPKQTAPGEDPLTAGLPTLAELALAGLNAVDDDPDGFLLAIEGGAVDWAMHANRCGRMIEEMSGFYAAIEAVLARLDAGSASPSPRDPAWENTLVIITADHDHLLMGPEGNTVAFQPLEDRGPGKVPGHMWMGNGHSNTPVPLWVGGAGRARFEAIETTNDETSINGVRAGHGAYFRQPEIGNALLDLLDGPTDAAMRTGQAH